MRFNNTNVVNQLTRLFNLDLRFFIKSGFWSFVQQIVGVSIGLLVSYLFGHFISKQLFGEYNLVLSYLSMFTFLGLPGIEGALVGSIGRGFDGSFVKAVRTQFMFGLSAVLIFVALASYYFLQQNFLVASALLICGLAFPFLNSFSTFTAFLTGKKLFKQLALLSIGGSVLFLIAQASGIFFFRTVPGLITTYLIGMILPSIIGYLYARSQIQTIKNDIQLVAYGKFLTLLSILPWVSGYIGNIILAQSLGAEALAVYAVSYRFVISVQKNFVVFHKPITSKLAAQTTEDHRQTLKLHAWKLLIIGTILCAVLWLAIPLLIQFFFTNKYAQSIRYGQWLSLALIPLPLTWVLNDMLLYQKQKRAQVILSTFPHLLKIGLYFILVPKYGIIALVLIFLIDRFSNPLIALFYLYKQKELIN